MLFYSLFFGDPQSDLWFEEYISSPDASGV